MNNLEETSLHENFLELCLACRSGDTERVDKLISTGVNVNQTDEWNYSPLVLASLCGHIEVVKLLLNNAGAVCDRETFEGARCIYGALNDDIRKLLLSFDIHKAVDLAQPFVTHISSLLKSATKTRADNARSQKDVVFKTADDGLSVVAAHRFVVFSRCAFFQKHHVGSARGSIIDVTAHLDLLTLRYFLNYIYLTINSQITYNDIDALALREIAEEYELKDLAELMAIEEDVSMPLAERAKRKNRVVFEMVENGREAFKGLCFKHIIGAKICVMLDLITGEDVKRTKATQAVPAPLSDAQMTELRMGEAYADTILGVHDVYQGCVTYYPVHRSVLIRSGYFETLFTSGLFVSASTHGEHRLPVIMAPMVSREVAEVMLRYLYYDSVDIPPSVAVDVLVSSDALFIERLKTMSTVTITTTPIVNEDSGNDLDGDDNELGYTIYEILQIAWDTRMERLEQHVAKLFATHLPWFVERERFRTLIIESAERIKERQTTDTIELLDDIRYYLTRKYVVEDHNYLNEKFVHKADVFEAELLLDTEFTSSANRARDLDAYRLDLERIDVLLEALGLDA